MGEEHTFGLIGENSKVQVRRSKENFIVKIDDLIVLFTLGLAILVGLALNHGDSTLTNGTIRWIIALIADACLALLGLLIFFFKRQCAPLLIVPIIYWLFINLDTYSKATWSVVLLFELTLFCCLSKELQERVYSAYRKYIVVMAAVGVVCYLAFVLGVPLPHKTVAYYSQWQPDASYVTYGVSYLYSTSAGILRLCGLFNEPGYFGTIIALILCADRFAIKRKGNIILLIAGTLTFSAAFFAIVFVYLMLVAYKRPKIMAAMIALGIFYLFILPNITIHNTEIAYLISRFTFSDGKFLGDNRSKAALEVAFSEVLSGPEILFGHGGGYVSSLDIAGGVSSYKTYIVDYGVMGFIIIYLPLLWSAIKRAKENLYAVFFLVCFVLSIYQRPNIFTLPYLVVLFGGIEHGKLLDREAQLEGNGTK